MDMTFAEAIQDKVNALNARTKQRSERRRAPMNAQLEALAQFRAMSQGGLTDADRLAQQQANRQASLQEQAQRGALMQNAQMRGMGGSGALLASQLAAQQAGANRAQENQTSIAQQAQQRAMAATAALGGLGGQMMNQNIAERGQALSEQQVAAQRQQQKWDNMMGIVNAFAGAFS